VPLVLARPPKVHAGSGAGRAAAVGLDQGTVQHHMCVADRLRACDGLLKRGGLSLEHGDALQHLAVAGPAGDGVVHGELGDAGVVQQPPQHEHCLPKRPQATGPAPGSSCPSPGLEQPAEVQDCLASEVEHSCIGATDGHAKPLVPGHDLGRPVFTRGFALVRSQGTYLADATTSQRVTARCCQQLTDDIASSLRPGAQEPLIVKPDGTIMNGNTRIAVLRSRGCDVDLLPREYYGDSRPMSDEDFWNMD
jgi:hypothetical protein